MFVFLFPTFADKSFHFPEWTMTFVICCTVKLFPEKQSNPQNCVWRLDRTNHTKIQIYVFEKGFEKGPGPDCMNIMGLLWK